MGLTVSDAPDGLAIAHGKLTGETADCDDEVADYASMREAVKRYSRDEYGASRGKHFGRIYKQHDPSEPIGYLTEPPDCRDADKEVWITFKADNAEGSRLLRQGFLGGLSVKSEGGRRWHKECGTDIPSGSYCRTCGKQVSVHYRVDKVIELSTVDSPCLADATLAYVKSCCGVSRNGEQNMNKVELQNLIVKGITEGVSQVVGRLHHEVHKHLAECRKTDSARFARIARDFRNEDHTAVAKEFEDLGREEQERMRTHNQFADRWDRMNAEVGHNDVTREQDKYPIRDPQEKFAKGDAIDEFYRTFGVRPMPTDETVSSRDIASIFE